MSRGAWKPPAEAEAPLQELAEAAAGLRRAHDVAQRAREDRDDRIVTAREAGATVPVIAQAAGISPAMVHRVLALRGVTKP